MRELLLGLDIRPHEAPLLARVVSKSLSKVTATTLNASSSSSSSAQESVLTLFALYDKAVESISSDLLSLGMGDGEAGPASNGTEGAEYGSERFEREVLNEVLSNHAVSSAFLRQSLPYCS